MKRCMDLGLKTAAETICCGIVAGLHKAGSVGSNGLLGWAPDFSEEEACNAVYELIRACPGEDRHAVHDRLAIRPTSEPGIKIFDFLRKVQ